MSRQRPQAQGSPNAAVAQFDERARRGAKLLLSAWKQCGRRGATGDPSTDDRPPSASLPSRTTRYRHRNTRRPQASGADRHRVALSLACVARHVSCPQIAIGMCAAVGSGHDMVHGRCAWLVTQPADTPIPSEDALRRAFPATRPIREAHDLTGRRNFGSQRAMALARRSIACSSVISTAASTMASVRLPNSDSINRSAMRVTR